MAESEKQDAEAAKAGVAAFLEGLTVKVEETAKPKDETKPKEKEEETAKPTLKEGDGGPK